MNPEWHPLLLSIVTIYPDGFPKFWILVYILVYEEYLGD